MAGTAAIVGAVVGGIGTIAQISQSKKAAKAQKRAEQLRQRKADIAAQRERVQAVREARIKRGALEASGARTGTLATSGFAAGIGAIETGTAGNLAYSQQQQQLSGQVSAQNERAAEYQSSAATFGAIGGLGQSIFQQAGEYKTIFKK